MLQSPGHLWSSDAWTLTTWSIHTVWTPNPWDSSKQILEEAKLSSPEIQDWDPTFCSVSSKQVLELHHVMVTAAKAAPTFTSWTSPPFFISTRCSTTPLHAGSSTTCIKNWSPVLCRTLLNCVPSCVVFPEDTKVVEEGGEDLWSWGYFQLSVEGFIDSLTRWLQQYSSHGKLPCSMVCEARTLLGKQWVFSR